MESTLPTLLADYAALAEQLLLRPQTYIQLVLIAGIYLTAWLLARSLGKHLLPQRAASASRKARGARLYSLITKLRNLLFPLLAILLLRICEEFSVSVVGQGRVIRIALTIAVLLLAHSAIRDFVRVRSLAFLLRSFGLPLLFLQMIGVLPAIIDVLASMAITVGNITVSVYGILRVAIFGSLLFWLGRISNNTGQDIIRRQEQLDLRTREVAAKLLEIAIFIAVILLLLQVMGINLTALAVFGGALGVGLGFGLQAIASNFISGIIILLDRSLSVGDYVELPDGRTGIVTELNMRSTTLETFDGKDIIVPNEKFIVESFTNWTHKDDKQRYRVDFSVSYASDVRKLVEIIKEVVASHPKVISAEDVPLEEQPDCEIDSFGDNGINMFVEFWMRGIDDGRNRVGGDLLLMILEALQQHGYEIPFPQREVRILNPQHGPAGQP